MPTNFVFLIFISVSIIDLCASEFYRGSCQQNLGRNLSHYSSNLKPSSTTYFTSPQTKTRAIPNQNGFYILHKPFPFYPFENSSTISTGCRVSVENLMKMAFASDLNALKVLDATAKPSSGILRGNVNQYGDFDECMESKNSKYCLAEIDLAPVWVEPFKKFENFVHSHYIIQETFDDPKHRVPGFTNIRWGFCIPRECSYKDVEKALQEKWHVKAKVQPYLCQVQEQKEQKESAAEVATKILFTVLFLCVIISSFVYGRYENFNRGDRLQQMLVSFSLQKNWKEITTTKENLNEIKALHGVRFLAALGLIMSHKVMSLFYNPYINRTVMAENVSMKWSVIGRTAIIFTDAFILLSGLLTANALFSDLDKYARMNLVQKIINRIFRILPNLVGVILFCTYILPFMGSGPLWPIVVGSHSELCKKYMWRNMLFIHNYFGFENMCLTHTHQVGIDMQLFLVTPLLVYILWKNRKIGFWVIGIVAAVSTLLRFWATMKYNLSHVVHCGIPISRMFDTANLSYILPTHRATIYLIGVMLSFVLRYTNKNVVFSKLQVFLMWSFIYAISFGTWLGPVNMSVRNYEYNNFHAAIYGALSPITWGIGISLAIYLINRGAPTFLGHILCWKYFKVFSKISYSVYLTQFPIFFYNVGITKHVDEYKSYMMLQIVETGVIIAASIILTLAIELPFQNIRKVLLENGSGANNSKNIDCNPESKCKLS